MEVEIIQDTPGDRVLYLCALVEYVYNQCEAEREH